MSSLSAPNTGDVAAREYYMVSAARHSPQLYVLDGLRYRPILSRDEDAHYLQPGETLQNALQPTYTCPITVEKCLEPGQYYPRVYWPTFYADAVQTRTLDDPELPPLDRTAFTTCLVQLASLKEGLARIFQVVDPAHSNLGTYGHEIRNLLILACTEAESHWRSVLLANGAIESSDRTTTVQYVRLLAPLRLGEYEVCLPLYHNLGTMAPFAEWRIAKSTESLDWYSGYNAAKHDRERSLAQATLGRAIEAVIACVVLVEAQFGPTHAWSEVLGSFFEFKKRPRWGASQVYIPNFNGATRWVPLGYSF